MAIFGLAAILAFTMVLAPGANRAEQEKARRIAQRAVEAFKAERYLEAGELFVEAHDLSGLPAPLRSAAKAFERGGDLERALESWRAYRALSGLDAAERGEADAEIARFEERNRAQRALEEAEAKRRAAELEAERARRAATATVSATKSATASEGAQPGGLRSAPIVAESPRAEEHRTPVAPWAVVGVGGAVLLTSLAIFTHASLRIADLDDKLAMKDSQNRIIGIDSGTAERELHGTNLERRWSGALLGTGLLLAAAGVAWLLLSSD